MVERPRKGRRVDEPGKTASEGGKPTQQAEFERPQGKLRQRGPRSKRNPRVWRGLDSKTVTRTRRRASMVFFHSKENATSPHSSLVFTRRFLEPARASPSPDFLSPSLYREEGWKARRRRRNEKSSGFSRQSSFEAQRGVCTPRAGVSESCVYTRASPARGRCFRVGKCTNFFGTWRFRSARRSAEKGGRL